MKKLHYILTLLTTIMAILIVFNACKTKNKEIDSLSKIEPTYESLTSIEQEIIQDFFDGYTIDNSIELKKALTVEYSIDELQSFFGKNHLNEYTVEYSIETLFNAIDNYIIPTIDEVNSKFPIELIRSNSHLDNTTEGVNTFWFHSYSVYKVKEGGYFYVFWQGSFAVGVKSVAYFTAYLSSPLDKSSFDSLEIGVSTAKDVASIDPNFELYTTFDPNTPIYSYSLIDDQTILEIEYDRIGDSYSRDNLIVKSQNYIPRGNMQSCLGSIYSKDLPASFK